MPFRTLLPDEVLDIVARDKAGEAQTDIARAYATSTTTVRRILFGLSYQDITGITGRVPKPTKPRKGCTCARCLGPRRAEENFDKVNSLRTEMICIECGQSFPVTVGRVYASRGRIRCPKHDGRRI